MARRSDVSPNQSVPDATLSAWARLLRVSQSLLSSVEADLKSAGLPPLAWYDALLELRRAGGAGLRPFELERAMLLAQYNMSRLIDRLVRAGYVERHPCESDGRGYLLRLTSRGDDLLKRMWPAYRAAIRRHFADKLTPVEAEKLGAVLGKLLPASPQQD